MKTSIFTFLAIVLSLNFVQSQETSLKGKELFGNMKARHIGPALISGRVNDIENHPTNARIIYMGAAGGGVWKSGDGGATFAPIFDEHAQSIGVVKLDPKNQMKLFGLEQAKLGLGTRFLLETVYSKVRTAETIGKKFQVLKTQNAFLPSLLIQTIQTKFM